MLSKNELKVLKHLVEKQLEAFEKEEHTIIFPDSNLDFLKGEVEYDVFLKNIIKKLNKELKEAKE